MKIVWGTVVGGKVQVPGRRPRGTEPGESVWPTSTSYQLFPSLFQPIQRLIHRVWLNQYETWAEAHAAVDAYVRFYNERRIHSALGYQTPTEFTHAQASLKAA